MHRAGHSRKLWLGSTLAVSNPFNLVCERCTDRLSMHQIKGHKALCVADGGESTFHMWEVVATRRALGLKVPIEMYHASDKARREWEDNQ